MHHAFLNSILAGKAAEAFCWMLIHSLWQGLLFTIITGVVLMVTKKSTAALRYNIVCALFMLFIATCTTTFIWQLNSTLVQTDGQQAAGALPTESVLQVWLNKFNAYFSANSSLVLMAWMLVFVAKCVKMMAGLVYSQRVRHHKTHKPAEYWQNKIAALCSQLQLKKTVVILESEIVKIPVVIGHLKPVIFIPLGLLTSLPAGEIEAVLLHELAHIRRNDYFINIIQVMAENVFFFNPALLWMSSVIREERESCCDDVAVAQTKSKKQFIQALISFKEHALHTNSYTTAFPAKKNQLLQRVSRIINDRNKTLNVTEKIFILSSFVLLAGLSIAVTNTGFAGKIAAAKTKTVQQQFVLSLPAAKIELTSKTTYKLDDVSTADKIASGTAPRTRKHIVYEEYSKVITQDGVKVFEEDSKNNEKAALTEKQQADADRLQAEENRKQAEMDRQQAEADRLQAVKDQEQARLDKIQADKDRQQAELDRQQAENDRIQAEKEKGQPATNNKISVSQNNHNKHNPQVL